MLTLKQGWHYILRSPRQSLYLILLVASLFAAILLLLSQYWSSQFTQPVEGFDRIIDIQLQQPVSGDQYQYYKDRQQSFTGISQLAYSEFPTTDGRYIRAEVVDPEFFQIFIPTLESGRLFQEADVELQASTRMVVSKALLEQQFPGENPMRIDSMQGPMDIVGVVEKGFHFPSNANAWQVKKSVPAEFRQMPSIANLVGKLAANVSLEQATEELERLLGAYAEQTGGAEPQAKLQTFPESTRQYFGFDIKMLGIILAVVAFSGVISIANIVGLDLLKRDREWRIRHLLGIAPEEIIKTPLGSFSILLAAGVLLGYAAYLVIAEIFAPHALVNSPAAPSGGLFRYRQINWYW